MRSSVLRNVDLPQPDGPMRAVMLFPGMSDADIGQRLMAAVPEIQIIDRNDTVHSAFFLLK